MGSNSPQWFMSSVGAIFAGGLSCGIYATNSPEIVKYICGHAPLDILVVEDKQLLQRISQEKRISEAFPQLKKVILVSNEGNDLING